MGTIVGHAWPYQEAARIREFDGRPIIFETGFGPSGSPHLGTFAEVQRTTWVRRAYEDIMGYQRDQNTRLIVFSDDMDALRKVPENIPNREDMERWVGYSLTRVPDPFGEHVSFAHHNNAMLRSFLDRFGFDYEFMSATEMYRSGAFDNALMEMWRRYDAVRDIILPTLGEDRRATYSPFMPILEDGRVIMGGVSLGPVLDTVAFSTPPIEGVGEVGLTSILGGHVKCQWKADWALRWLALGVDYEMAGKDLIDSVTLSSKIVRAIGGKPPVNMIYEMFLDKEGRKISKSLGNGMTLDEWLSYGPAESLSFYLYREPKKAKKLYEELVPRAIDEFWQARARYPMQSLDQQRANPIHHIVGSVEALRPPAMPVTFGLILNLIGILAEPDEETVWGYIRDNYAADAGPAVKALIPYALRYHAEQLAKKVVRRPLADAQEMKAFVDLGTHLRRLSLAVDEPSQEDIQFDFYEVGKANGYAENLRGWFQVVYEVIFGSSEGPRLGTFVAVYGIEPFVELLDEAVRRYNGITCALAV